MSKIIGVLLLVVVLALLVTCELAFCDYSQEGARSMKISTSCRKVISIL